MGAHESTSEPTNEPFIVRPSGGRVHHVDPQTTTFVHAQPHCNRFLSLPSTFTLLLFARLLLFSAGFFSIIQIYAQELFKHPSRRNQASDGSGPLIVVSIGMRFSGQRVAFEYKMLREAISGARSKALFGCSCSGSIPTR